MTLSRLPLLLSALLAAGSVAAQPAADPVVDFTVVRADTLRGLSRSMLVSPTAWREVARLNRLPDADRIVPGQVLKIPARLLRAEALDAKIVSANGDVRVGGNPVAEGAALAEGQAVQTGTGSSAVIELADGSRVRLPPSSLAEVAASRRLGARGDAPAADGPSGWFAGTMRVLRGSVEVIATKVLRARPLEVVTPTAVVGVRGTRYRVSLDEGVQARTRGEVVEGSVRFDLAANARAVGADVGAGFGAVAEAGATGPSVVPLPSAPDLSSVPERFERPLVRFALPGEPAPLRVQVASDAAFDRIVLDQRVDAGDDVRLAGLADALWHVRARRVGAQGIEGFDASRSFTLKARPQPPVYRAPRADAKQQVGDVDFAWAPDAEAARVRLQVARDAGFTSILQDREVPAGTADLRAALPAPGRYFWRLASVRTSGDQGPFSDPQGFELRPDPEPPRVGRSADGSALNFEWGGRPQDRQQVEFARDAGFAQVVERAELGAPGWSLAMPSRGGRYYFRYRSIEPDGYVTPFSDPVVIDVPRDWGNLMLLLPLLLLL